MAHKNIAARNLFTIRLLGSVRVRAIAALRAHTIQQLTGFRLFLCTIHR
jgi:hypothetical protein